MQPRLKAIRVDLPPLDADAGQPDALFDLLASLNARIAPDLFVCFARADKFSVTLCSDDGAEWTLNPIGRAGWTGDEQPLGELTDLFASPATLNHAGVNVPMQAPLMADRRATELLLSRMARVLTYPDSDNWLFVHPPEGAKGPLFEIAFEPESDFATLQIDVNVALSQAAVTARLPRGVTIGGLEGVARSVYVRTGWDALRLRLDFRWPPESGETFAEWLAVNGRPLS